jgi:hypothetical protein
MKLPPQLQLLHSTFNIDRLKPYRDGQLPFPDRPPADSRPPPDALLDTGDGVYELERILAKSGRGRNTQYLIMWKGYPVWEATWEPQDHINAPAALSEFNNRCRVLAEQDRA